MAEIETRYFPYGPEAVAHLCEADAQLGAAIRRLGLQQRIVMPDLFAALVHAMVGQLISAKAAQTIWSNMLQQFDAISPVCLAAHTPDDIQRCGMTMKKAIAIHRAAQAVAQGELLLDTLMEADDDDVIRRLTKLHSVGRWTAEMVLLHGLLRPDVVSWGDIAIRRGMMRLYGLSSLDPEQFAQYCQRYAPYGSVASIYLWVISFETGQEGGERMMHDHEAIRAQLLVQAEEPYRLFASSLLPNIDHVHVLGVRLPLLRQLAKQLANGDWRTYLQEANDYYFEEVMLQGMVIGYVKADLAEWLDAIARFVPKINNWSVCDSFCNGLKKTKVHQEQVWTFLQPYFASSAPYDLRFAVVMLLSYFVDDTYIDEGLVRLDAVRHEDYYVKMAVAWAVSICYIAYPARTLSYLHNNTLDDFTYNKALQKITESLRIDVETKQMIRQMKRK